MMPELGPEFFAALVAIILADLVLAGDNAVVIALAARNLPPHLRRRAVFYGAMAAVLLRGGLTALFVLVLSADIPWVQMLGGITLVWIAWRLAVEEEHDHEGIDAASTMRGAITTILMADVIMSLDNVLAVAGFAKGDPWLVVFGLVISIPIVMGGATILLRVIDRHPWIVWVGAALVAYVGVELVLVDPVVHPHLPGWLEPHWAQRSLAAAFAVVLTSVGWYVRLHDDPGDDTGGEGPDVDAAPAAIPPGDRTGTPTS